MKKVLGLSNGFENKRGKLIIEGKEYEVLDENPTSYKVKDNQGGKIFYPKVIFEEIVEKKIKKKAKTEEIIIDDAVESDE